MNPQDSDVQIPHRTQIGPISPVQLGVSLSRPTHIERAYPNVLFVAPDGEGSRIGLRVGDIITTLNGRDVGDLECSEFTQLVRSQSSPYSMSVVSAKQRKILVTPFNRSRMRQLAMV